MKELVEKLNGLKLLQKSMDWDENIPVGVYNEYFQDYEEIDSDLDVDKHRWYETSITVIRLPQGFLGIRSITDLFSERSTVEDCYHTLEFFEMEEVQTITYRAK